MNQTKPVLIFDMDGVILDTERLVLQCWNSLAPQYGISDLADLKEIFLSTVGTTRKYTNQVLHMHYGADFPAEQFDKHVSCLFHSIADTQGIPIKPGAAELLQWASEHDFHIGLASSTRQQTVENELKQAGLHPYFDYILGGDRIARSKPFPDIYLAACHDMGVEPADAFAIEDSYNGVRAAAHAGMQPIMIPDTLPPTQEMYQLCFNVFPNLFALTTYLKAYYEIFS